MDFFIITVGTSHNALNTEWAILGGKSSTLSGIGYYYPHASMKFIGVPFEVFQVLWGEVYEV